MLKINKDVEYALMSLVELGETGELVTARHLAEKFHIPYKLLTQIMLRLARADVVTSIQGSRGGYRIDRSPSEITMEQIIEAVRGTEKIASCLDDKGRCEQDCECNIKGIIEDVQNKWNLFIASLTLEQFLTMKTPVFTVHQSA